MTETSLPRPHPAPVLGALGWDARWADAFTPYADIAEPGRVVLPGRAAHQVETPSGTRLIRVAPDAEPTTVGDWLAVAPGEAPAVPLPRRTALRRQAPGRAVRSQLLAANMDLVLLVVPLTSWPNLRRLERLLALAWESGAQPAVALTKADLASDADAAKDAVVATAPGVAVLVVSTVTGAGLDEVRALLGFGQTMVLLGTSGAGKSTLANAVLGEAVMPTESIRTDGKGRHTTTHRQLLTTPAGVLIDTPGLRGVGLSDATAGVERTFADLEELASACRFADCRHDTEPDCAVLAAVADGQVAARRLTSWQHLQREVAWQESRQDARLRAQRYQQARRRGREGKSRARP